MRFTQEQIASVCHAANTAYCKLVGDVPPASWEEIDSSIKAGTTLGVKNAQEGTTPRASHAAWMKERLSNGWVFGPVLDREKHVHPNLVPYDQLPEAQRKKDELFILIVSVLS